METLEENSAERFLIYKSPQIIHCVFIIFYFIFQPTEWRVSGRYERRRSDYFRRYGQKYPYEPVRQIHLREPTDSLHQE